MRAFASFALAMFLSMVAAQLVAQQLAVALGAREEFILVMVVVGAFTVLSMAILSIAFASGVGVAPINTAAALAALLALAASFAIVLFSMARNNWGAPTTYDIRIVAEILLPSLIAVAVQWFFVRRCRQRQLGEEG